MSRLKPFASLDISAWFFLRSRAGHAAVIRALPHSVLLHRLILFLKSEYASFCGLHTSRRISASGERSRPFPAESERCFCRPAQRPPRIIRSNAWLTSYSARFGSTKKSRVLASIWGSFWDLSTSMFSRPSAFLQDFSTSTRIVRF